MEKSKFFEIDNSVIILLFLVVILVISIFSLINYQHSLVSAYNADEKLAALPTRKPDSKKISATPTIDPYSGWDIYENEEFNFRIKFPTDLHVTSDPHRDGKSIAVISSDTRETIDPSGWSGIFIYVLPNPQKYDSHTFIQWNIKNDPLNSGVSIKKFPLSVFDASITHGEVVGSNGDSVPKIYISRGDIVLCFAPNYFKYNELLIKILPTFSNL